VVAVAKERVMNKHGKVHDRRVKVLNHARELARSGQHPDHKSIIAHLEHLEGFAEAHNRLRDLRGQLDRLCALAQSGRSRIDIPGR
jgi:hypothetical protein